MVSQSRRKLLQLRSFQKDKKGKSKIILETTENSVKARNIIFDKPTIEAAALTKE